MTSHIDDTVPNQPEDQDDEVYATAEYGFVGVDDQVSDQKVGVPTQPAPDNNETNDDGDADTL